MSGEEMVAGYTICYNPLWLGVLMIGLVERAPVALWACRRKKLKNQPSVQSALNTGKHI
jgi:hypothetical protein